MYEGGAVHAEIDLCLRESGFLLYNLYKPKTDAHGVLKQADAIYVHGARLGL
jgi:hypothetical protein